MPPELETKSEPAIWREVRTTSERERPLPFRERYAALLFPAPLQPRLRSWRRVAFYALLIVVGSVIALYRTPRSAWDVMWAEDGAIFIDDALQPGFALLKPYAGYLHLVPRLAAQICAALPLDVVPIAVTIVAAVITSLSACAAVVLLSARIRSVPLLAAAWGILLVAPVAGGEVQNNLANLHWYLMVSAVCALVVTSRSLPFTILQCVVVVAAVGSDPLMLMFTPLLIARWVLIGGRAEAALGLSYVCAALLQLGVTVYGALFVGAREFARTLPGGVDLVDYFTFRVAWAGVVGITRTQEWGPDLGVAVPGLLVAGIVAALVWAAALNSERRYSIAALAGSSGLFFVVVYTLQWNNLGPVGALNLEYAGRYAVLPAMLLMVALILAFDAGLSRLKRGWARITLGMAVLLLVAVPIVSDYRWINPRAGAPSWDDALAAASQTCDSPQDEAEVRIAPVSFQGPLISCVLLEEAG